jgi:hypothetical protein
MILVGCWLMRIHTTINKNVVPGRGGTGEEVQLGWSAGGVQIHVFGGEII